MTHTGPGSHGRNETAATEAAVRAWFDKDGWRREPADLRVALQERGADEELVCLLIDEGADKRRASVSSTASEAAKPEEGRRNGGKLAVSAVDKAAPQNLDAEEHVLGAILLSAAALIVCRDILAPDGSEFYLESHATIWKACLQLADQGGVVDAITVRDQLEQDGLIGVAGGRVRVHELAAIVPATANAGHYARIVANKALLRLQERLGLELTGAARAGSFPAGLRDQVARLVEKPVDHGPPPEAVDAGSFVFDEPTAVDDIRVWGEDTQIGWASGEGLMLVGPDGVGKTTLGQQLALARCGLRDQVLGMPVTSTGQRVLYIAADRPRQAARSMRRMVGDLDRQLLEERMTVWRGPLPAMLNEDRTLLARLAKQFDVQTIVVDSLKDVAVDIATDEAGGRIASAFQHLIANGVEVLALHHPRKPGVDQHRKPKELGDVYGSRLIFGAFGSVIMLWGDPGDAIVELRHLKQPVDEIGPWNIRHDHQAGRTTVETGTDLVQLVLNTSTAGLTAAAAAGLVYEKEAPTKNEVERTRSKLDRLCKNGRLVKMPGQKGSAAGGGRGGAAVEAIYLYNGPAEAFA